jgi:mannosyltransferase
MGLDRPGPSNAVSIAGGVTLVISIVLSPPLILTALGLAATETRRLWLGTVLFRLGLGALGLYLVLAGRLPLWEIGARAKVTPAEPPPRWAAVTLLVGILVLALALRLYRLGAGLWYDEINAYVLYMGLSFGEIVTTYDLESQHFLFTLLARAAFALFGEGPASLRLPAALFGTASVAALYLLGRQLATKREALLSAALLAVSYHHVWFSQNARGYSALLFWTLLSTWLMMRALDEGRAPLWLGYATAVALGMFTHVTMVSIVVAHALVYAVSVVRSRTFRDPATWSGAVLGFGLAALFTLQLYALVLPQFFSGFGMKVKNIPEWTSPLWTLRELAGGLRLGFAGGATAASAVVVLAIGLLSFARTAPVLLIFLFVPAAIAVTAALAMGHPLWPRFFFFLMGFGVLVVVRGALVVGGWVALALHLPPRRATLAGTLVALLLVLASATTVPTAWLPKQDYLGARNFVEAERQPGDAIVTVGLATYPYRAFHRTDWDAAESVNALDAIRARAKRTWVVYTIPLQLQGNYPNLMALIRQDFPIIRKFEGTLNGGTIYVCRADGTPAAWRPNVGRN